MSTDRPGILFEKSVLAKTFKIPSGTLMYQMEDHPQNKRVGQNCPKFSKVPVVVGRTGDSFQQNHGFYGTRVALSTSSGASHPRFRHLFRGYTVYTYTLGKQSAAGTPKWWFKNSSFSSRATNYLCSSHPLFYQLKLSEQPNLSKFAYCIIYLWLHGSIRAQHRTLIKIMDDQSLDMSKIGMCRAMSLRLHDDPRHGTNMESRYSENHQDIVNMNIPFWYRWLLAVFTVYIEVGSIVPTSLQITTAILFKAPRNVDSIIINPTSRICRPYLICLPIYLRYIFPYNPPSQWPHPPNSMSNPCPILCQIWRVILGQSELWIRINELGTQRKYNFQYLLVQCMI